jgi:hypothetical protein
VKQLKTLNKTHESPSSGTATIWFDCKKCLQKQPSPPPLSGKVPCDIVAFAEAKKSADAPARYHDI